MSSASIDSAFDSRLVAQIAGGDARAVGKLFDRHAGPVYNLARQVLRDDAQAERTVFELFLRLWHEANQFDPSREEIKTRLLQNAYVIAKAQLPPTVKIDNHWENLTDAELEETLSKDTPPAGLLDGLKAKLMATIEPAGGGLPAKDGSTKTDRSGSSPATEGGRSRNLWPILAFGFGIVASVLAVYSSFNSRRLAGQMRESTIEFVALRQELKITQAKLGFALSPQTEVLTLTGQPAAPEARAKLVWDPADGQGILIVSGLAPAPADRSYQLWVIAGGKPVSAAVFAVDSTGASEVRVAHLPPSEHIFAFNVTLELTGGVAEPTGEKLLSGNRL
ncbi:MAG: anti-sigma factor [candidate division Zixibacteria bacterium]|nr:anti-sigma factor [candidate division Zixibacteria bacterium]